MTTNTPTESATDLEMSQGYSLSPEEFDEIDTILDDLRTRHDEIPQWEFCEGFMAALVVCRRPIAVDEYFPVLLDMEVPAPGEAGGFTDAAQAARFMALWTRRWDDVVRGLGVEINGLDDENAYHPEVMDVRGAVASLPEEDRAKMEGEDLPSFGQVWALALCSLWNPGRKNGPPRATKRRKVAGRFLASHRRAHRRRHRRTHHFGV